LTDIIKHPKQLSEKEMAQVLKEHLNTLDYVVVPELVLDSSMFDIKKLSGKNVKKVRIDVAAFKDDKVTFIEVENGLWVTHPLIYREFAQRVLLAYPDEHTAPTDREQIKMAKEYGIGIVSVSLNRSVCPIVPPEAYDIPESISKAIISLIEKRIKKGK